MWKVKEGDRFYYEGMDEDLVGVMTEEGLTSGEYGAIDSAAVDRRINLYQKLDNMDPNTRRCVIKIMQYKILNETMDSLVNLKSTPEKTWKSVIRKMNAISGINIGQDKSGFDYNKFLKKLIPMVATIAGLLLALREAEREESEASEQNEDSEITYNTAIIENTAKAEAMKAKSLIMKYCNENLNGFSLSK